jgi:hypothetical protein
MLTSEREAEIRRLIDEFESYEGECPKTFHGRCIDCDMVAAGRDLLAALAESRAREAKLREALELISAHSDGSDPRDGEAWHLEWIYNHARTALKEQP